MKLRIGRRQIDQIIGVRKDGSQLAALLMLQESADFLGRKRTSEPLHVVLHENLHSRALDRAGALDRHVRPTRNRHVGAEQRRHSEQIRPSSSDRGIPGRPLPVMQRDLSASLGSAGDDDEFMLRKFLGASRAFSGCLQLCIRKICRVG